MATAAAPRRQGSRQGRARAVLAHAARGRAPRRPAFSFPHLACRRIWLLPLPTSHTHKQPASHRRTTPQQVGDFYRLAHTQRSGLAGKLMQFKLRGRCGYAAGNIYCRCAAAHFGWPERRAAPRRAVGFRVFAGFGSRPVTTVLVAYGSHAPQLETHAAERNARSRWTHSLPSALIRSPRTSSRLDVSLSSVEAHSHSLTCNTATAIATSSVPSRRALCDGAPLVDPGFRVRHRPAGGCASTPGNRLVSVHGAGMRAGARPAGHLRPTQPLRVCRARAVSLVGQGEGEEGRGGSGCCQRF